MRYCSIKVLGCLSLAPTQSMGTRKELIQFLYIAKGSCGVLKTLIITKIIGYINKQTAKHWLQETTEISAMLGGLINKRKGFSGAR